MKILFIAIVLLFWGCGRPGGVNPADKTSIFTSAIIDGGTPLDEISQGIAYRVCFALRAKRFHYQSTDLNGESRVFRFENSETRCDLSEENLEDIEFSFQKDGDQLVYSYTADKKLFYGPLTDKQGLLSPVCEKILKGETSTNVFVADNNAYEVFFFSNLGSDGVMIKFGTVDPNNEFQFNIDRAHYYYILTDTTVSGDMLGLVHKAEEVSNCKGSGQRIQTVLSKDL